MADIDTKTATTASENGAENRTDYVEEYRKAANAYATTVTSDKEVWTHITTYTFNNFLMKEPDCLEGAAVLDLACGCGQYARLAADRGASRVVGVDISPDQIAQALAFEQRRDSSKARSNIQFIVRDASTLAEAEELGQFDVVLAVHLLGCAQSRNKMKSMLKSVSSRLKKGGRLVGICGSLSSKSHGPAPRTIHLELEGGPMMSYETIPDGKGQQFPDFCQRKYVFRNADQAYYYLTEYPVHEETLQEMLAEAGFRVDSMVAQLTCSPEGREMFPSDLVDSVIEKYGNSELYYDATKL